MCCSSALLLLHRAPGRGFCFPISRLEQISRKTQDSHQLKCLHTTQGANRSYGLQDSAAGKEAPCLGHLVLQEMEAECTPEQLNEQITHACDARLAGATAARRYSRHQRAISVFILLIFLGTFWKSCHEEGGQKAKELNKKIL